MSNIAKAIAILAAERAHQCQFGSIASAEKMTEAMDLLENTLKPELEWRRQATALATRVNELTAELEAKERIIAAMEDLHERFDDLPQDIDTALDAIEHDLDHCDWHQNFCVSGQEVLDTDCGGLFRSIASAKDGLCPLCHRIVVVHS